MLHHKEQQQNSGADLETNPVKNKEQTRPDLEGEEQNRTDQTRPDRTAQRETAGASTQTKAKICCGIVSHSS